MEPTKGHPVQFWVEYPDRALNRVTTAFRIVLVASIAIVLGTVTGQTWQWGSDAGAPVVAAGGRLLFVAPLLMILFRYARGIFDFVQGVIRWHNRVVGYALTMVTDRYPPFRLSA
jgi:hypothetical protein